MIKIEKRAGVNVVVFSVGCRPATHEEVEMYNELVELRALIAERGKGAVAWLHESRREADVITTAVKNVWGGVAVGNMAAYNIPLFLSAPTIPEGIEDGVNRISNILARIDAELGKSAVAEVCNCGIMPISNDLTVGEKLFLSPTLPEGMTLVPIEPTLEMLDAVWGRRLGRDDSGAEKIALLKYKAILDAAQGERNVD